MDPTGYVKKMLGVMPLPNNYEVGEGLNTAGFRWVKSTRGGTNRFGFGNADVRKQINTKFDHNFNAKSKLGVSYTYERSAGTSSATFESWPDGYRGSVFRRPQTLSLDVAAGQSQGAHTGQPDPAGQQFYPGGVDDRIIIVRFMIPLS